MTPQERQLIDDLFGRLSRLENSPRDPEAQVAIAQGLRTAPNAVYALVQTVLVQDEALKRADERIQELERGAPEQRQPAGFLDSMRDAVLGQDQRQGSSAGSVPNVRAPGMGGRPVWNSGEVMQQTQGGGQPYGAQQPPPMPGGGGGGSFLGTAAAAAAGVVGGSLLLGSIRSMMGGSGGQQSFGDTAGHSGGVEDRRPWGDRDLPGGDLAKDAGVNDIASSRGRGGDDNSGSRQGMFDQASNEGHDDEDDIDHDSDGFDDDGGDSDYA
jgi:uncharacterized protein